MSVSSGISTVIHIGISVGGTSTFADLCMGMIVKTLPMFDKWTQVQRVSPLFLYSLLNSSNYTSHQYWDLFKKSVAYIPCAHPLSHKKQDIGICKKSTTWPPIYTCISWKTGQGHLQSATMKGLNLTALAKESYSSNAKSLTKFLECLRKLKRADSLSSSASWSLSFCSPFFSLFVTSLHHIYILFNYF